VRVLSSGALAALAFNSFAMAQQLGTVKIIVLALAISTAQVAVNFGPPNSTPAEARAILTNRGTLSPFHGEPTQEGGSIRPG